MANLGHWSLHFSTMEKTWGWVNDVNFHFCVNWSFNVSALESCNPQAFPSLVTSLPVTCHVQAQLTVFCEFVPSYLISVITLMLVIPASLSRAVSFFDGGLGYRAGTCGYGHPYRHPWLWPSEIDHGQELWGITALPPGLLSPVPTPSCPSRTPSRPLLINPVSGCSRKAAGLRLGIGAGRLLGRVTIEGGGMVYIWFFGLQGWMYHWL